MDSDEARKLALFRYGIIAPLIGGFLKECSKEEFYRMAAEREYTLPDGKTIHFKPATIKKWFLLYQKNGLDALVPRSRSDAGQTRTLNERACEQIPKYKEKFPKITGQKIYEKLLEDGFLKYKEASIDSLYRYLRANNLTPAGMTPEECLAFEFDHANDCWQADTVNGPWITVDGKKEQTFLISFIDDASRMHPHGEFFFNDNAVNVQKVFKSAIKKAGLPRLLFDDNGSPYRNHSIDWICAQLGVVLIHSREYFPRGKGKSEKSHMTCSQRFMDCTDFSACHSLDELNQLYWDYLEKEYHHKKHSSIGMAPLERYMKDYEKIRFIDSQKLEEAFLHQEFRKVSKTACVSLYKTRYEVPQKYIGRRISLRYKPEDLSEIYIYDEDTRKRCETVYPVNLSDNKDRKRKKNICYENAVKEDEHV